MAETATALNPLLAALARRIAAAGPLTVAEYMEAALFDPHFGYYATRDPLGARGDFVTAPEVSQVFGELLGLWCAEYWQRMGAPDPVRLVELGPGRGTLLADALRATRTVPDFLKAARLHLVERSRSLRAVAGRALARFAPQWHDSLEDVPHGPMLLLANEFLDVLPVRQFVRDTFGWRERLVSAADDPPCLAFTLGAQPTGEFDLGDAPAGAVAEFRPAAQALARAVGARLVADGGAALFIDYGHGGGFGDTLQAVRRHRPQHVLDKPGAADLTAHVDFAAFRAAAERAGARTWGPVAQGGFLAALGIEARAERLIARASDEAAFRIRSGCRRLVDPTAMGELFKALALTAPNAPTPAGF